MTETTIPFTDYPQFKRGKPSLASGRVTVATPASFPDLVRNGNSEKAPPPPFQTPIRVEVAKPPKGITDPDDFARWVRGKLYARASFALHQQAAHRNGDAR